MGVFSFLTLVVSGCLQASDAQGQSVVLDADYGPQVGDDDDEGTDDEEECDGVDNDEDGEIDEDFPDDDENGRADCLDQECPPLDVGTAESVEVACRGADLVAVITDLGVPDCTYGPVKVAVQAGNQGGHDVEAGVILTLYAYDDVPRAVATATLPAIPRGTRLEGIEFDLTPADVGDYGFIATVDDDGTGVDAVRECDETNNRDEHVEALCP